MVTYVGIQLINITRLAAPYRDQCSDDWLDDWVKEWAISIDHGPYTSQFCLKLCLQTYTLTKCDCWTVSAPPPNNSTRKQCNLRRNPGQSITFLYKTIKISLIQLIYLNFFSLFDYF